MKVLAFINARAHIVEIPESVLTSFPSRELTPEDLLLCTTVKAIKDRDLHIVEYEEDDD